MSNEKLLPCPFCGGTEAFVERYDYSSAYVQCDSDVGDNCSCQARGPIAVQDDDGEETPGEAGAIRNWNRRALAAPVASAAPSGEREKFEAVMRAKFAPMDAGDLRWDGEKFTSKFTQLAFDMWNARAAIAHQPPKEAMTDEQILDLSHQFEIVKVETAAASEGGKIVSRITRADINEDQVVALCRAVIAASAPNKQLVAPSADDVEWIVNDMGELGVRIAGRCYFCYKGDSLVYDGKHDDGEPILHRNVGKREFGETVWPMEWIKAGRRQHRYTLELVYTPGLSFGSADNPKHKWLPLPVEVKS